MIPFIDIPSLKLFGLEFHPFGMLVATGFFLGTKVAAAWAERMKLEAKVIYDLAVLFIIFGFFGAHLIHLLLYDFDQLLEKPWSIFFIWAGISSYGGFLGAAVTMYIFMKRKRLSFLPYADALILGLLVGWIFGRLGCFTAHDHPGKLSDFFLAVKYPGGARHDLGFYEVLVTVGISALAFPFAFRRSTKGEGYRWKSGTIVAGVLVLYSVARFFLDYLRALDVPRADARYFGLTPAQYFSILGLGLGIALLLRIHRKQV